MRSPLVNNALRSIARIRRSDDGQDLMEYGMLMALIAILALGAVTTVGDIIHRSFWQTIALASNF
jgi:Flp pilus assembly pilin Flp